MKPKPFPNLILLSDAGLSKTLLVLLFDSSVLKILFALQFLAFHGKMFYLIHYSKT